MAFKPRDYIKPDQKIENLKKKGMDIKVIQTEQMKNMGILEKESRYDIIASTFVKYCMKRIAVHQKGEEFWFYNFQSGCYEHLSESRFRKVFFEIIIEPDANIWTAAIEKKYIDYFKRCVSEFEVTGYEPYVLQFQNGILVFSGDEMLFADPSPDYFCQFRLPYDYDEEADCPKFMKFLDDIFEGDQERIDLIQEVIGASLLYEDFMQNLVVFLGKGSNGKSLLATMIKHMLGKKNVSAIPIDRLSGDRFSKQNLDHKLLNISSETNSNKTYSTADIKSLTGGDSVEVEKKYCDSYTTEIHAKFILLANDMIRTSDYSDGFYRRLIIIPFNKQYHDLVPGQKKEEGKAYKNIYLESELFEELSGIFNFALDGLFRLMEHNYQFTQPKICVKAAERYEAEHNIVKAFVKNCIQFTHIRTDRVKKTDVFKHFEQYCLKNQYYNQFRKYCKRQVFYDKLMEVVEHENLLMLPIALHGTEYYCYIQLK